MTTKHYRVDHAAVFTTGQIARLLHVAPRTTHRWFDAGKLKGYRIPMSQDRRVSRAELIRFIRENGLPLPPALAERPRLLVGSPAPPPWLAAALAPCGWDAEYAGDFFTLGRAYAERLHEAVLLDLALGTPPCLAAAGALSASARPPLLLCLAYDDHDPAALAGAFGAVVTSPDALAGSLATLTKGRDS